MDAAYQFTPLIHLNHTFSVSINAYLFPRGRKHKVSAPIRPHRISLFASFHIVHMQVAVKGDHQIATVFGKVDLKIGVLAEALLASLRIHHEEPPV